MDCFGSIHHDAFGTQLLLLHSPLSPLLRVWFSAYNRYSLVVYLRHNIPKAYPCGETVGPSWLVVHLSPSVPPSLPPSGFILFPQIYLFPK